MMPAGLLAHLFTRKRGQPERKHGLPSLPAMTAQAQTVAFPHGSARVTTWEADDIHLYHRHIQYQTLQPVTMHNPEDLCMWFNLRGTYDILHENAARTVSFAPNQQNILYSPATPVRITSGERDVALLGIKIPKAVFAALTANSTDALQRFADQLGQGQLALLSPRWAPISPAMHHIIQEVLHCRFTGPLQALFLRAKCLELLVLQAEAAAQPPRSARPAVLRQPADRERLVAARDYVQARLHQPPSLPEVARAVGLNEYKLKRGFKELFGETVFGYLTQQRLELARTLLLDTQKTASEIGYELGYSSPQHFNNAFRQKYGQPPQTYKR